MKLIMRTSLLITVLLILTGAGVQVKNKLINEGQTAHRYRIELTKESSLQIRDAAKIIHEFGMDLSGVNYESKTLDVITNDKGISALKAKGLSGKILESKGENFHSLSEGETPEVIDPKFLNPARLELKLKELNAAYPNLTRLEQIGTSTQGRPVWALLISTTPTKGDVKIYEKPSIIIDGMHHAREIMTTEVVVDFADFLLSNYDGKDPQAKAIVDGWNLWMIPMFNPDGNNIVWTKDNWWRKNARSDGGSTYGVDLNRNYSFSWNKCNGSSGTKSSDTYRGDAGNSEPETKAIAALADVVHPTAYISYHSYSELVIYPYGCQGEYTAENELESKIGKELSMLLPTDSGKGYYQHGTPWQLLYSVDGDSMAYMFGTHGAVSFTFEVNQSFQPSYTLRQPTVEKHRKMLLYFLKRIGDNMLKVKVLDGKTSLPVNASVKIDTILHKSGERDFSTNSSGIFFKVLDPGAYKLNFTDQKGRSAALNLNMAGTKEVAVSMQ